jgi:ADP-heptose:LPS heptosyltransferase
MHVKLMRKIDFWVGVPACFGLSVLNSFSQLLFSRSSKHFDTKAVTENLPQKILFIELSEMGSAIIAHSALVRAKEISGKAPFFLIFKRNRESCELLDLLPKENILVIDDHSFPAFAISALRTLFKIWRMKFDCVIDLELFSRFTALLTFLSGAKFRIGFHRHTNEGLYRGNFLTHPVNYNTHQHMELNFLALVESINADTKELPLLKADLSSFRKPLPQRPIEETSRQHLLGLLRAEGAAISEKTKIILMNPDPGDAIPIRGWPEERFHQVGRELLARFGEAMLVVIGLARSKPFAERMQAELGRDRCIDLTGKTKDLKELVALMEISALLITNDSGPAHMASLSSIKSLTIFGPETPALYGPLGPRATSIFANYSCSPCLSAANHRDTVCTNSRCLKAISAERVLQTAVALLKQS